MNKKIVVVIAGVAVLFGIVLGVLVREMKYREERAQSVPYKYTESLGTPDKAIIEQEVSYKTVISGEYSVHTKVRIVDADDSPVSLEYWEVVHCKKDDIEATKKEEYEKALKVYNAVQKKLGKL